MLFKAWKTTSEEILFLDLGAPTVHHIVANWILIVQLSLFNMLCLSCMKHFYSQAPNLKALQQYAV